MKTISGKELTGILEKNGWKLLRIKGSHHIFGKENVESRLSVPVHGNKALNAGLLNYLLKTAGIDLD